MKTPQVNDIVNLRDKPQVLVFILYDVYSRARVCVCVCVQYIHKHV